MTYSQLIQPDLTVTGQSGYCLEMQENVWGSEHWFLFAEQAWNQNGPNHPDEQPPEACVPVYWTYYDVAAGQEYGHIATWVPGRGVYSSTFNTAFGAEWYPNIQAMTDRINQIAGANGKYLGWSEVIANLILVKGEDVMDEDHVKALFEVYERRDPSPDELTQWVGKDATELIDVERTRPAYQDTVKFIQVGEKAVAEDWQGQIAELQTKLAQQTPAGLSVPVQTSPPTPADQEKVNVFVALWRALFG